MKDTYNFVAKEMKDVEVLVGTKGILDWDQGVTMPEGAVNTRAEQMALIEGIMHNKLVSPKLGEAIKELDEHRSKLTDDERVNIREWLRDHERAVKLPQDFVEECAKHTTQAQQVWVEARKESNFGKFEPALKKMIELKKRQAEYIGYKDNPYDALLDEFEPYMTVKELDPIINNLRDGLVPIVSKIGNSKVKVDSKILEKNYPEKGQEEICKELMKLIGLSDRHTRLDRSPHPFCSGAGPEDVRITTRYSETWLPGSIYGVMHESGHALYELNFDKKYYWTPLAKAVSLGIHESQSRLWENYVGRGLPFTKYLFPKLKKLFKTQLENIGINDFYRSINCVKPSLIRVEADEVTYNLHIIIRYEIEKALINGEIKVRELPNVWNEKMKKYLGVKPANDAEGVLQDIHWSIGAIGYFPTYLLGNLYSAQWWNKMKGEINDFDALIEKGDCEKMRSWLIENIHREGRRYSASDLVKHVTGEPLNAKYFLDYLKDKFGEIYNEKL